MMRADACSRSGVAPRVRWCAGCGPDGAAFGPGYGRGPDRQGRRVHILDGAEADLVDSCNPVANNHQQSDFDWQIVEVSRSVNPVPETTWRYEVGGRGLDFET